MTPLPPPPPPLPRTDHIVDPPRRLVAWIAIVFLAGVLAAFTHDGGASNHPSRWDPRVASLAKYVETERGLEFRHPVEVDFLTAAEYTKGSTREEDAIDKEGRAELDRQAGELRALGLASGTLDLFSAYNSVSDSGTLAFYDPIDDRVRVRGKEMTIGLQVTLVHELTHALQDQHFDLERLYDDDLDSSESTAFRSLIEGDALRIEEAYTSEMSTEERAAYDKEYAAAVQQGEASTSEVPDFINASFSVPYLLGQPFVTMLADRGGNRAVDEAFRHPPTTEEHLFDPASFLDDEGAADVDLGLSDKVKTHSKGPFGSPSWYLMLAERIDPKVAFEAALGWGGDNYATFERKGRACVRAVFRGDTGRDEGQMTRALRDWAEQLPGEQAEVIDVEGHPGFEACDPGEDVDLALSGRSAEALYVPSLWGYLVADAATQVEVDATTARCYARGVVGALSYDQMTDTSGATFQGDDFQDLLNQAFKTCAGA